MKLFFPSLGLLLIAFATPASAATCYPSCIEDLRAMCVPVVPCTQTVPVTASDPPVGYYCFANGVKIASGQYDQTRTKPDGSVCYSMDLTPVSSGTTYTYMWKDAAGTLVATESYDYLSMGGRYHMVSCGGTTYSVDVASAECQAEETQYDEVATGCTNDPACKAAITGAGGAPGVGGVSGAAGGIGGGAAPVGGQGGSTCPANQNLCNGACTDILSNYNHCGSCENFCNGRTACVQGVCTRTDNCAAGQVPCGSACVDTVTDPLNCGACGQACTAAQVCVSGVCTAPCDAGTLRCDLHCWPANSAESCGSCTSICTGSQLCCSQPLDASGACHDTAATSLTTTAFTCLGCPASTTSCGTYCADMQGDATNCGTCGYLCGSSRQCVAGVCESKSGGGCAVGSARGPEALGLLGVSLFLLTTFAVRRRRRIR